MAVGPERNWLCIQLLRYAGPEREEIAMQRIYPACSRAPWQRPQVRVLQNKESAHQHLTGYQVGTPGTSGIPAAQTTPDFAVLCPRARASTGLNGAGTESWEDTGQSGDSCWAGGAHLPFRGEAAVPQPMA